MATSAANNPDKPDVANIEEIQAYMRGVPTFQAVERSLADQGEALRWATITVERWDDAGLPLELHIPIIATQAGESSQRGELQFERTATGDAIVRIATFNAAGNVVQPSSGPGNMLLCNIGAFVSESTCGIASNTFKPCVGGTSLWQLQTFFIDFYQNGRQLNGATNNPILFNCGPISSDPVCSNACFPPPPPGA